MSAPMTPERLAEIRAWLAWEYRSSFGERGEQIAAELLAEVERLTGLLGSHADGHRCTCTMTDPGIRHGDNAHPPEWQHDPWCLTHPDMDVILAEVERLTGLLDSVRTWATEHYDPLAHEGADTSELIEILDDAELIETPEQSAALVDTVPDHLTGDLK